MRYREFKLLREIYLINKAMKDDQTYEFHTINDVVLKSKFDKETVNGLIRKLAESGHLRIYTPLNKKITNVAITPKGVIAVKYHWKNILFDVIKSILIPAVVSILCSLIV